MTGKIQKRLKVLNTLTYARTTFTNVNKNIKQSKSNIPKSKQNFPITLLKKSATALISEPFDISSCAFKSTFYANKSPPQINSSRRCRKITTTTRSVACRFHLECVPRGTRLLLYTNNIAISSFSVKSNFYSNKSPTQINSSRRCRKITTTPRSILLHRIRLCQKGQLHPPPHFQQP